MVSGRARLPRCLLGLLICACVFEARPLAVTALPITRGLVDCPETSPCLPTACSPECGKAANETGNGWACVTVAPGSHAPENEVALVEEGYKGLKYLTQLSYRVVFHNNTLSYPCGTWCSNENKLFGFSRGFVEVMWQSCMFSWRATRTSVDPREPSDKIMVWGYGWKNSTFPPWQHPTQNPFMGYLNVDTPHIFKLNSLSDHCEYSLFDGEGSLLKKATTPQEPYARGPSYFFNLYFGGTETTTAPVTVSYSRDLIC